MYMMAIRILAPWYGSMADRKDVPSPICEKILGIGSSKIFIHNVWDLSVFIRVTMTVPTPSLNTSPIINIMAPVLVDSSSTHKVLSERFSKKKGLLEYATYGCCEISEVDGSTQKSARLMNLKIDDENQMSIFLITQLEYLYNGILGMPSIECLQHLI